MHTNGLISSFLYQLLSFCFDFYSNNSMINSATQAGF
jgi:hypothetical protein